MGFIFTILNFIDQFFSVIIHGAEQVFFQKRFRSTWIDSMGSIGKLESILQHQVNVLENLIDFHVQREELGMVEIPEEDTESRAEKDFIMSNNKETLKFFKSKLGDIQKIKNELQKIILT